MEPVQATAPGRPATFFEVANIDALIRNALAGPDRAVAAAMHARIIKRLFARKETTPCQQ
jgi:hypothetical protein